VVAGWPWAWLALLLTRSVADEMKQRASAAAAEQRRKLENMFDPQVIERMRVEFQAADADGSGEIDAEEAAAMLGKLQGGAGSSSAELRKSAESLLRTMDADRNGQISFEEFCFRCASWPPAWHCCTALPAPPWHRSATASLASDSSSSQAACWCTQVRPAVPDGDCRGATPKERRAGESSTPRSALRRGQRRRCQCGGGGGGYWCCNGRRRWRCGSASTKWGGV
jgi:hypothetical protein